MTVIMYTARNLRGQIVPNAVVTVVNTATGAKASLSTAISAALSNPVTADSAGAYGFQVCDGCYTHKVYDPVCRVITEQTYTVTNQTLVSGVPTNLTCSTGDDMSATSTNGFIMDPATEKFLTDAGFMTGGVSCGGAATSVCTLNLGLLIAALDRALPTIDAFDDGEDVVDGLNALSGNASYALQATAGGLQLTTSLGAVISTVPWTAIAAQLVSAHASNSLTLAGNADGLLFENDAIANP